MTKLLALAVLFAVPVRAQEPEAIQGPSAAPKTRIEALVLRKGSLVTKQFRPMCNIRGSLAGTMEVNVLTVTEVGKEAAKVRGLTAEVKETGRLERENTCFLDADEMEALGVAAAYLQKTGRAWQASAPVDYTEVVFQTKGNFSLALIGGGSRLKKVSSGVTCGSIGKTNLFGGMAELEELAKCVGESIKVLKAAP